MFFFGLTAMVRYHAKAQDVHFKCLGALCTLCGLFLTAKAAKGRKGLLDITHLDC